MVWMLAISIALLGYAYAGYPALIWMLSGMRGRPVRKGRFEGGVSVLIAAHNEAETLPRKLENLLALAEDEPIREICIGLDGCTYGTGERIKEKILISNIHYPTSNLQGGAGERSEVGHQGVEDQPATCNLQPATPISNVPCPMSPGQEEAGARSDGQPSTFDLQSAPQIHLLEFERCRGKAQAREDALGLVPAYDDLDWSAITVEKVDGRNNW